MLNPDRIRAKLQDISGALERLDRFRTMSREGFLADEDAQDIARSRLLTAMEAALNIEVFFKMAKQHLKLAKEIQCRDFDALIAHTSFVFMRYMFLSYQCRMETDDRSYGVIVYSVDPQC